MDRINGIKKILFKTTEVAGAELRKLLEPRMDTNFHEYNQAGKTRENRNQFSASHHSGFMSFAAGSDTRSRQGLTGFRLKAGMTGGTDGRPMLSVLLRRV